MRSGVLEPRRHAISLGHHLHSEMKPARPPLTATMKMSRVGSETDFTQSSGVRWRVIQGSEVDMMVAQYILSSGVSRVTEKSGSVSMGTMLLHFTTDDQRQ